MNVCNLNNTALSHLLSNSSVDRNMIIQDLKLDLQLLLPTTQKLMITEAEEKRRPNKSSATTSTNSSTKEEEKNIAHHRPATFAIQLARIYANMIHRKSEHLPSVDISNDETVHYFLSSEQLVLYDEGMCTFSSPISLGCHQHQKTQRLTADTLAGCHQQGDEQYCSTTQDVMIEIVINYNLGLVYALPGGGQNYDNALLCFQKALRLKNTRRRNSSSGSTGTSSHNTVTTSSTTSSSEDSPLLTVVPKNQEPSFCAILHNIGQIYYRSGQFDEAVLAYSKALETIETNDGADVTVAVEFSDNSVTNLGSPLNKQTLICMSATLNSLAIARFHQLNELDIMKSSSTNDLEPILKMLTKAYSINQAIMEKDTSSSSLRRATATILNNIGRTKFKALDFAGALSTFLQTYEMRLSNLGSNHLDLAATLCNIADTQTRLGNLANASEMYKKFISIAGPLLGEGHCDVANALLSLGQVLQSTNQLDDAISYLSRALKACKIAFGKSHKCIATIYNNLGHASYKLGHYDTSIQAYKAQLDVELELSEQLLLDHQIPQTLVNVGQVYEAKNMWKEALCSYERALYFIQNSSKNSEDITIVMSLIAYVYEQEGRYSLSEEILLETLEIKRRLDEESPYDISITLNVLGLIRFKMGSFTIRIFF